MTRPPSRKNAEVGASRASRQRVSPGSSRLCGTLDYTDVGVTRPAEGRWMAVPSRGRMFEKTVHIGEGERDWKRVADEVMRWVVKTRSGFEVAGESVPVIDGETYQLSARVGPIRIREPVQVVATVVSPDRVGFAYGTLSGHPVSGEEAFIVHRRGEEVMFTLRSVTASGQGWWRPFFTVVWLCQRLYRRRYLKALCAPKART